MEATEASFPPPGHDELSTNAWYYVHQATASSTKTQGKKSRAETTSKPLKMSKKRVSNGSEPIPMELFDFDCNLTHEDLKRDVGNLLQQALKVGVQEMLVPGATIEESQRSIELCRQYPSKLFPTAGVHPYNALAIPTQEELSKLFQLLELQEVRAVGECGLDYSPGFPDPSLQKTWFTNQLAMACKVRKPLFLHERLAHQDFMELIGQVTKEFDGYFPPAVVHCFTGKEEELKAYVDRDWYIGITGFICKKHGAELREMVRHVPLDRLVLETDAPYMGFPKCRRAEVTDAKKQYPNVPSAMPQVAQAVATALGKSPQEIARLTRANARRFLRL